MLKIVDQEHYEKCLDFAKKTNREVNLKNQLDYLATYAIHGDEPEDKTICELYKDSAPYSFYFVMLVKNDKGEHVRWFNGGLIFHGNHDGFGSGSAPTFSVTLEPTDGWSIHT